MQWLELTVQVHPEAVESVSELLSTYTSDGIVIEEPYELSDDGQEYRILHGQPVIVHAYLPMDGKEEATKQQIAQGLWHFTSLGAHFVGELQTCVVNEEDWANAWKDYYHVTHIGKRLVIRPSWREYTPKDEEVVLTLDPGMAFGTGVHPTTRMCLEQVEQKVQPGMRILDVGTGSGILALAAAKLGAASVYAIDNSSVAVESAQANAALNDLTDRIQVVLGILDEAEAERTAGQYDLVLANIIAHIIGSIAPQLAQTLAPHGLLVVSGIIEARRPDAEGPLLEAGLELVEEVKIDDWLALVYRKRVSSPSVSEYQ
ncbi:50S ribosomal protein L11 methyltransferase [Tengunoibacter tsumagoiensis]|uniref:Ribosomal protein L11 methyltransferase n=1 Tax=Tengunoibacter tsumagoiensis TaxID=2014871 RepID=A0A402A4P7_9CHLR|nr:50S ribosomal protein L11 methyltransferase [Tengunoibacter tsumagoiensis]GCE14080.1 ribosomal protein L11 methyltransferase [Tengunoibacter tsumagoiensis]